MKQSLLEGERYCPENYDIKKKFIYLPHVSTNEKNYNPADTAKRGYLSNDTAYFLRSKTCNDHVCSHLRRPHSSPPRGLAFGTLDQFQHFSMPLSTVVRRLLEIATTLIRACVGPDSGGVRPCSARNALHAEQPRSALEAHPKPPRSGVEEASKQSRSGVEDHSKHPRSVPERHSKLFHVCSLLRRPQPLSWRGLAIGVCALLLTAVYGQSLAQQAEIRGRVVAADDERPLEGVTVTSKLRGYHTMTND